MRKMIALGLIAGLLLAMGGVDATAANRKKKKVRTAQGTYSAPATVVGNCTQFDGIGCMTIVSGTGERYITASVKDAHGQPVAISVQADTDGDMFTDKTYGNFCGKTAKPIKIDPGASLVFWVSTPTTIVATKCAPGEGTQGTLRVKFSNLP
jgi:hypothetical protein